MDLADDPSLRTRLTAEPSAAFAALSDRMWTLHAELHPASRLRFVDDSRTFVFGRHEIPGLALLFASWDSDATTMQVAHARASALLTSGEVVDG